jgi:hypothetical protein
MNRYAILLLSLFLLSTTVEARSFRWKDEKGVTHYSETIPPEYANRSVIELDDKGRMIKSQEVLTEEQRQAREAEAAHRRKEEAAELDRQRHDRMLLKTYASEAEIDAKAGRDMRQAEANVSALQERLKEARQRAHKARVERDEYSDSGRPLLPETLQKELAASENQVNRLEQELMQRQAEIEAMKQQAEADKQRYRELTGKKP